VKEAEEAEEKKVKEKKVKEAEEKKMASMSERERSVKRAMDAHKSEQEAKRQEREKKQKLDREAQEREARRKSEWKEMEQRFNAQEIERDQKIQYIVLTTTKNVADLSPIALEKIKHCLYIPGVDHTWVDIAENMGMSKDQIRRCMTTGKGLIKQSDAWIEECITSDYGINQWLPAIVKAKRNDIALIVMEECA